MDSFLKKLFSVSPTFIITFPIALIFGLCVAWFFILSNSTENLIKSHNPLKKMAGWTLVCIFGVDYYIWVATKVPYHPIHDNYGQILLLATGIVLSLVLFFAFLFALYLVLDAKMKEITLEHRIFVWLGNDAEGKPFTLASAYMLQCLSEPVVEPEPVIVKKPRKPRAKKVAPPVDEYKVTNGWLAKRNAKEALRRST